MHGDLCEAPNVYIEATDIHSMNQHRLASKQIKKGGGWENQTEYEVASEVPKVGEMHQPPAEEPHVSINMINQALAILDYNSEGPEPEYDVEEQWYHMEEPDQPAIHDIDFNWRSKSTSRLHLSRDWLHLWPPICNKKQLRHMYPEYFYGIGKFNSLDDNAKPVIHPPRKIPLALQPKLDKELDEMVEQVIITLVTRPSAWVNAFVIHKKPNCRLRTCLDPKDLNMVIKRENHPVPRVDDITPKLCGSTHSLQAWFKAHVLECKTGWRIFILDYIQYP